MPEREEFVWMKPCGKSLTASEPLGTLQLLSLRSRISVLCCSFSFVLFFFFYIASPSTVLLTCK